MRLTRRQLRQIINEALNEGQFAPSIEGQTRRYLTATPYAVGGGLAGGVVGAAVGQFALPIPGGGAAIGFGPGAFIGAGIGGSKGMSAANEKGYYSGDIPNDHPLHADNLQMAFDGGNIGSTPEQINEYIQSFITKGFTGDLFSVIYRSDDFAEGELKSILTELGYLTDEGKVAMDVVLAKSRAQKAIKDKAGEVAQAGVESSKGFLASLFGEPAEEEETALAQNNDEALYDDWGDPIDQKKT